MFTNTCKTFGILSLAASLMLISEHASAYSVYAECFDNSESYTDSLTAASCTGSHINDYWIGNPGVGSTAASADLATGELKASATAQSSSTNSMSVVSRAIFDDTVTFSGNWTGDLTVTLSLAVDGSFTGTPATGTDMLAALTLTGGSGQSHSRIDVDFNSQSGATVDDSYSYGDFTNSILSNSLSDFEAIIYATILIPDFAPVLDLHAAFYTWAAPASNPGYANTDFYNTAFLSIDLPEGITYTSESGVLLTETSNVPEPATLALMGLGLAGISFARKKKAA